MTRRRRQEGTSLIPSNLQLPEDCRAVSEVLARVGDKWTVLVVTVLGEGDFDAPGLERGGLVIRTVFPTIPPRVDYAHQARPFAA
jgi:DNA-binding HxlR family transcriptional regulator